MPNITDPNIVEAIVEEYTTNGRNRSKALETVGYDSKYIENAVGKIWGNVGLQNALAKIEARTAAKGDRTRATILKKSDAAYDVAETAKSATGMTGALRLQCDMLGFLQDKAPNELAQRDTRNRMSAEDLRIARAVADILCLREGLERPVLPVIDAEAHEPGQTEGAC